MRSLWITSALLLGAMLAMGQANNGAITGAVSDPAGAVVPNAAIEIKNIATGQVYNTGSSATGNFVQPLPAGTYEMTVTVTGFKRFVRENIEVRVATGTRQDITLEVGQTSEQVTVAGQTPLLETESGEVSHTVNGNDLDNLPIMFLGGSTGGFGGIRNPLDLTLLLPGAEYNSGSQPMIRINGLPSNSEGIRVEGQDASNGLWRQITNINQPSADAIQEVSVQTSNYAAEYGQAAGGYFNFTMKSGGDQFHGSAYDYFVNEAFNAGEPFTDAGATNSRKEGQHIRNAVRQNDYGFSIGGPVMLPKYNGRNRTFFFFNFEQFRQSQNIGSTIYTAPTPQYLMGDFATATQGQGPVKNPANFKPLIDSAGQTVTINEIFDPLTTMTHPDGSVTRTTFMNQQIPLNRINPVFLAISKYFPQPNLPGLVNNYQVPAYSNFLHIAIPSIKIDHSVSPTIKLSLYYQRTLQNSPNNNGDPNPMGGVAPTANRSDTVRLNYDQSLKPTLLLHIGIGYLQTFNPSTVPGCFDQTALGLHGYYDPCLFPTITGINSFTNGGLNMPIGAAMENALWEQKPTGNASVTWVKGNHTYKFGGELVIDGFPDHSAYRTDNFGFSQAETADPYLNGATSGSSGFAFASFFLGYVDNLTLSPQTQTKLGNHAIGLYAQDSWKITRKLTLDYGLRYDYETFLQEEHGRMQDANFYIQNTEIGRPGVVVYNGYGGGRCNCSVAGTYPYNFGPRLGLAYQITPKTVLRAGSALSYGTAANNAFLSLSVADSYSFSGPSYGIGVLADMSQPNPFPNLTFPNFNESKYPAQTLCPNQQAGFQTGPNGACYAPQSPSIYQDPNTRPPRIFQWSIGLQRELQRNIVVEADYVGNRGAYETAPLLDAQAWDALNITNMAGLGINMNSPADRALLLQNLNSPAVIQRGFGEPYPGFPVTLPLEQALRPYPQWDGVQPFLGPPIGDSWYDALQAKLTKRFSRGLEGAVAYTYSKELTLGANSDTTYYSPGVPPVNDVFNRGLQKDISSLGRPQMLILSGIYTTPGLRGDSARMKVASDILRGWSLSAVLRYQSGALIQSPISNNQLLNQLARGSFSGPSMNKLAIWGGGATQQNIVSGRPFFLEDPNCGCFNPQTQLILNPAAWSDAPPGQFGSAAAYYNSYRWQRQPMENVGFGRVFAIGKEGRYQLLIRAEFQNIFNRLQLSMPINSNGINGPQAPTTRNNATGLLTGGFGWINTIGGGADVPRSGQMIARFQF